MLHFIGQDPINCVLLLCKSLGLLAQSSPPPLPINPPQDQFNPVLLSTRILRGQKFLDPVELLLHRLGNGSKVRSTDGPIAQGDHHSLSRFTFAVAVRFKQLEDLAALGMLQTEKHIPPVWAGR